MQQVWPTSVCFVPFPFAVIGSIPNYTVWLESPLRVGFNSSRNCSYYLLFRRDIKIDLQFNAPGDNNNTYFVTFTIPSVSIEFNNVKMTVKAEDSHRRQIYQRFFIYTRGLSCGSPLKYLHMYFYIYIYIFLIIIL